MNKIKNVGNVILFLAIFIFCIIVMMPLLIMVFTSFKTPDEIILSNFRLLPNQINLDNYIEAMGMGMWGQYFINSFIVTIITVIGSLFFNSLAGYSLARLKFKGRKLIFIFFMIGIMLPPQSYLIPQFIMLRSIPFMGGNNIFGEGGTGLLNTYGGLIIPFLSGSFGVFLCRQFYISFPKDLDDAAMIDGCTKFQIYSKIFLPLSGTILATLAILKTVATWNDFLYPLVMTNSEDMYTVQLGLQNFRSASGVDWSLLMAATVVTILPIAILFLFAQKYFVQGIANTGLKG